MTNRAKLLEEISAEGRRNSTSNVLFHQVVADLMGLNTTDYKSLDIIIQREPVSAGELAELTGLTTGSITTVLDRLEAAGYVRRVADPQDRRKVLLETIPERFQAPEVEALFGGFLAALAECLDRYSDDELGVILDYLRATTQLYHEQAVRLRAKGKSI